MKILGIDNYKVSQVPCCSKAYVSAPKFANQDCLKKSQAMSFCGNLPMNISYVRPIKSIEKKLKTFGLKAQLLFDGGAKNLFMAQKIQNCILEIKKKNIDIPKAILDLTEYNEVFEGHAIAAITEISTEHGKPIAEIFINTPLYKYKDEMDNIYRIKSNPINTTIESDFHHEFAHVYQGIYNPDNYNKLLCEKFDEETSNEIKKYIGAYAAVSKAEFVAEYFSFKMTGKQINSEKLDKLYKECMGPELKRA